MFSPILGKFIDTYFLWCNSEVFPKISCALHNQNYSILNYLMYFCTLILFYALFITGDSLVDNWNLIINFPFFYFFFFSAENLCFSFCVRRKFFILSESDYRYSESLLYGHLSEANPCYFRTFLLLPDQNIKINHCMFPHKCRHSINWMQALCVILKTWK